MDESAGERPDGGPAADTETGAGTTEAEPAQAEPAVRLSPRARRRVVELGADALGRMRPEDIPPALRRVARFTARHLVQRGAVAITAALDTDDAFRERVADAVEQALPALATAVRDSGAVACDPADAAAAAFLLRPPGWRRTVAADLQEWQQQQLAGNQSREQQERLAAELATARESLRQEKARRRDEVQAAGARAGADVDAVRRELRARTGELRAAERERDEAVHALATDRERAERAAASAAAEIRTLRARIGDLERAASGERRTVREVRALDDARLAVLVDSLQLAASGIRSELALPPTHLRPADAVDAAASVPGERAPGRTVDDAGVLYRLLHAPGTHLIVDGYNVSKSGYPDLDLGGQRRRLVSALAALAARTRAEVTVAFDGTLAAAKAGSAARAPRGVRVRFSAGESADDLIRALIAAEPPGRVVVVVTSDAAIVSDVRAAGQVSSPAALLLSLLG